MSLLPLQIDSNRRRCVCAFVYFFFRFSGVIIKTMIFDTFFCRFESWQFIQSRIIMVYTISCEWFCVCEYQSHKANWIWRYWHCMNMCEVCLNFWHHSTVDYCHRNWANQSMKNMLWIPFGMQTHDWTYDSYTQNSIHRVASLYCQISNWYNLVKWFWMQTQ